MRSTFVCLYANLKLMMYLSAFQNFKPHATHFGAPNRSPAPTADARTAAYQ